MEKPITITPTEYDAAAVEILSKYTNDDCLTFATVLIAAVQIRETLFDTDKRNEAMKKLEGLRK